MVNKKAMIMTNMGGSLVFPPPPFLAGNYHFQYYYSPSVIGIQPLCANSFSPHVFSILLAGVPSTLGVSTILKTDPVPVLNIFLEKLSFYFLHKNERLFEKVNTIEFERTTHLTESR